MEDKTVIDKTVISVVGHTNTGKTTLIRTLTKSRIGEVEDRANVTEKVEVVSHDSMQAIYKDCPGFEVPDSTLSYIKAIKEIETGLSKMSSELLERIFDKNVMKYDLLAVEAIKESDVVLYVVNTLDVVPEISHQQEIRLIKEINDNIIGIGNKSRLIKDSSREYEHRGRIEQWEQFFQDNNVEKYIMFDAWWDRPDKISQIYSYIEQCLPEEKKYRFRVNLKKFKDNQLEILKQASSHFSDCIQKCKNIRKEEREASENHDSVRTRLLNEVCEEVRNAIKDFTEKVSTIYRIAAENPTRTIDEFEFEDIQRTDVSALLNKAAAGTTVGGTVGTVIGGLISLIVPAVAPEFFSVVVAIFGGGFGVTQSRNNYLLVKLSSDNLRDIATICISIIWALSCHGYGNCPKVSEKEIEKLLINAKNYQKEVEELFTNAEDYQNQDQNDNLTYWEVATKDKCFATAQKFLSNSEIGF